MSRLTAFFCVLLFTSTALFANIGETTKQIIKRYGKPDRKQVIPGGQKMWFRVQDYEITVYLKVRDKNAISVQEEYRKPNSRFMKKDMAKQILDRYKEKAKWKLIATTRHNPPKTKVDAKNTHFTGPDGAFAVYCLNNDGSGLSAEHRLSAYLAFFDATAYREFNARMGKDVKRRVDKTAL